MHPEYMGKIDTLSYVEIQLNLPILPAMSIVTSIDSVVTVSTQRKVYPSILDCTVNDTLDTMGVADNCSNVNLSLPN